MLLEADYAKNHDSIEICSISRRCRVLAHRPCPNWRCFAHRFYNFFTAAAKFLLLYPRYLVDSCPIGLSPISLGGLQHCDGILYQCLLLGRPKNPCIRPWTNFVVLLMLTFPLEHHATAHIHAWVVMFYLRYRIRWKKDRANTHKQNKTHINRAREKNARSLQ